VRRKKERQVEGLADIIELTPVSESKVIKHAAGVHSDTCFGNSISQW